MIFFMCICLYFQTCLSEVERKFSCKKRCVCVFFCVRRLVALFNHYESPTCPTFYPRQQ
ncbi:unnamed protein product [Ixodes pacificus]